MPTIEELQMQIEELKKSQSDISNQMIDLQEKNISLENDVKQKDPINDNFEWQEFVKDSKKEYE